MARGALVGAVTAALWYSLRFAGGAEQFLPAGDDCKLAMAVERCTARARGPGARGVSTEADKMSRVMIGIGLVLLAGSYASLGQDKIEREKGVRASDVPEEAREWLRDAFEEVKSPRWYQEFHESGYSFEAKFKWRGRHYSAEFDAAGVIQDVEIELSLADLPASVQEAMTDYFVGNYSAYRILRLQIQYSGPADELEDFFDENDAGRLVVRYEAEFSGTTNTQASFRWEGLFDDRGVLIRRRRVITPPMENLIF
jgi:hypothetical protein